VGEMWCLMRKVTCRVGLIMYRYTKALDNIKALRKERTAELKVDKERLHFYKADKDKAERVSGTCAARTRSLTIDEDAERSPDDEYRD
jgi:hypothetical protein